MSGAPNGLDPEKAEDRFHSFMWGVVVWHPDRGWQIVTTNEDLEFIKDELKEYRRNEAHAFRLVRIKESIEYAEVVED